MFSTFLYLSLLLCKLAYTSQYLLKRVVFLCERAAFLFVRMAAGVQKF